MQVALLNVRSVECVHAVIHTALAVVVAIFSPIAQGNLLTPSASNVDLTAQPVTMK